MVGRRSMCQSAVFGCRGVTIPWQFLGRCPAAYHHLPPPPTNIPALFQHFSSSPTKLHLNGWQCLNPSVGATSTDPVGVSCSRHALCAGPLPPPPPPPLQGQMEGDSSGRLGHVYWPLLSQKNSLSVYMYAGRRRTTMAGIEARFIMPTAASTLCRRRHFVSDDVRVVGRRRLL